MTSSSTLYRQGKDFPRGCLFCGGDLIGVNWRDAVCEDCQQPAHPLDDMGGAWACREHMAWHPAKVSEPLRCLA